MRSITVAITILAFVISPMQAWAWGADGHRQTGWIADRLLTSAADNRVVQILGYDLGTAAVWADCAKYVKGTPRTRFEWKPTDDQRKTCAAFTSPDEVDRMVDYVSRNWATCPKKDRCHNEYHYTDVAIQRDGYAKGLAGTEPYDIVQTINAAITFLETDQSPGPVNIKDDKEAILLLAHFVGDLHQPLHVGAVYLSLSGGIVDPDGPGGLIPATETQGGNKLFMGTQGMHGMWDDVLTKYSRAPTQDMVDEARTTRPTSGPILTWSTQWATDTFKQSQKALGGLTFGQQRVFGSGAYTTKGWPAYYQPGVDYSGDMRKIQRVQLRTGGQRLAQLIQALYDAHKLDR